MLDCPLLKLENHCPECVSMDLKMIPLDNQQFELRLNVSLAQPEISILTGKIRLGLRALILGLNLQDVSLVEVKDLDSSSIKRVDNPFSRLPHWEIRHLPGQKFLQDDLTDVALGVVKVTNALDFRLAVTLTCKPAHVNLSNIEGLWRHDITPNKHGILERKLAKFIYQTRLNPFVSEAIFATIDREFNDNGEMSTSALHQNLKDTLQLVYQANENNFVKLADIAQLNLLTDFAGADLTGANLSGLKLSSANLKYANLRGADLTDIDLSEANLSYSHLNGADLTGAYLEGANLRYCNLQSASLALANVMGADLSYANLIKTNLTNTSLSQATVEGAVFDATV